MVNQLHDNNLSLDTQKHLVGSSTGFRHGHSRIENKTFGDDLDSSIFASDGVFGNLDATYEVIEVCSGGLFSVMEDRKDLRHIPELPLPMVRPILHCPIIFASSLVAPEVEESRFDALSDRCCVLELEGSG